MTTANNCPHCYKDNWTQYPAHRQCDNCGHMERTPVQPMATVSVVTWGAEYVDAGQHDSCLRERGGR